MLEKSVENNLSLLFMSYYVIYYVIIFLLGLFYFLFFLPSFNELFLFIYNYGFILFYFLLNCFYYLFITSTPIYHVIYDYVKGVYHPWYPKQDPKYYAQQETPRAFPQDQHWSWRNKNTQDTQQYDQYNPLFVRHFK